MRGDLQALAVLTIKYAASYAPETVQMLGQEKRCLPLPGFEPQFSGTQAIAKARHPLPYAGRFTLT